MVLNREGLSDWKIKIVDGNEGFCDKENKVIKFGKESKSIKLMLHEIAHCLTDTYHYSDEFEQTVERLEKKYLETFRVMCDKPLMDAIREARKSGSKNSLYKPLG